MNRGRSRTARTWRWAASLPIAVMLAMTPAAEAQSRDAAAATELFEKGRSAMKQQDYATACAAFDESFRFDTKVGTLLNLADCEEHVGKLVSARAHWQQAIDLAHAGRDARESVAKQRFAAVDPRVAKLAVLLVPEAPQGVTVRRDDVELGTGSLGVALPMDPGQHTIVVGAPGYEEKTVTVPVAESEVKTVVVGPGAKLPPPPPPPPPVAPEPPRSSFGAQKVLGIVAVGVGVAGGALGIVFGLKAKSSNDASFANDGCDATNGCNPTGLALRTDAVRDGNISTIGFIAGGAFLVTGVVLWLTSPSRSSRAPTNTGLVIVPRPLGLGGTF
jgi:hypothetical protein